jgi:ribose transport system substrate-binding protein
LSAKPASGKTFVFLQCQVTQCAQSADEAKKAVEGVGWKYQAINYTDTDPATLVAAMKQALDLHPVAVTFSGTPQQLWTSMESEFEKAGAIIVPSFMGPAQLSKAVPANIAGPSNDANYARILADWVASDSGGNAKVLVQNIPVYGAVKEWVDDFKTSLKSACAGCKVSTIDSSGGDLASGAATSAILSALQADTSINYFLGYNGVFFGGLNANLANAGLHVKVGGMFPLPQNITDVMNGSGGAFVAVNTGYSSWLAVDAALRFANNQAQLPDDQQLMPVKLVTKASATQADLDFTAPKDFRDQFFTSWQVSN